MTSGCRGFSLLPDPSLRYLVGCGRGNAAMRQFSAKVSDVVKPINCSPLCCPDGATKAEVKVQ